MMKFFCKCCQTEHPYSGFVYKLTNKLNSKWYIGSHSGCIDDGYLGSGIALRRAINKYGTKVFEREILFYSYSNQEYLLNIEEIILIKLKAREDPRSYNLKNKGIGQDPEIARRLNLGKKIPRHIVEKQRKALIESEKVKGSNNPRSQKVVRLDTEEVFEYGRLAAGAINGTEVGISEACHKGYTHRGIFWMFYDEWLELGRPLENPRYSESGKSKWRIVRLSDGQVFENASIAAREYNLSPSHLSESCNNINHSCGGHHWMKYNEWKKQGEPLKILSDFRSNNKYGYVIDMLSGTKYKSSIECSKETKISDVTICKHINNLIKNRRFISETEWIRIGLPILDQYFLTHQPREVINVETGKIFKSIKEAARSIKGSTPGLHTALKHKRKYKGVKFNYK